MTRINANIKPKHLIDQHLIAEYREIVRIPNYVNGNIEKSIEALKRAPNTFKLGTGHVLYFYDKLKYLHNRFLFLKLEMMNRNINNNMTDEMFLNIPEVFYNSIDTLDLVEGNKEVVERIIERINSMKNKPTIHGIHINIENYSKMLKIEYN